MKYIYECCADCANRTVGCKKGCTPYAIEAIYHEVKRAKYLSAKRKDTLVRDYEHDISSLKRRRRGKGPGDKVYGQS